MNQSRKPSPAIVVAVLALVAALAGTAIAEPTANTAVSKKKTKKIANKQIDKRLPWQADDIADNAVTEQKLAAGSVSNGKLQDGAVTQAKLSSDLLTNAIKVKKVNGPVLNVPAGQSRAATTVCPAGSQAIAGETALINPSDALDDAEGLLSSRRDADNPRRWLVRMGNSEASPKSWQIGATCISGIGTG